MMRLRWQLLTWNRSSRKHAGCWLTLAKTCENLQLCTDIASLPSILPSLAYEFCRSPLMSVHSLHSFHRPWLAKIVSLCRSWQISTKHCYRPTTSLFGEADFWVPCSWMLSAGARRCNKGPWSTISRWKMSLSFGSYAVGKC